MTRVFVAPSSKRDKYDRLFKIFATPLQGRDDGVAAVVGTCVLRGIAPEDFPSVAEVLVTCMSDKIDMAGVRVLLAKVQMLGSIVLTYHFFAPPQMDDYLPDVRMMVNTMVDHADDEVRAGQMLK